MRKDEILYDLHLHSQASDGLYSPNEVVLIAKERGLKGIAFTDHDTVKAFHMLPPDLELLIIPGIEINTDYQGEEVHILGYFIDIEYLPLLKRLDEISELRELRCKQIVDKVNALGISLTWGQVMQCMGEGIPGRTHIGMALVKQGVVSSVEEAMQQYIGRGAPAYVERYRLTPMEAIQMIHEAGGIAVLAHPGLIKTELVFQEVLGMGIDGIEAFHPDHSAMTEEVYIELARKKNLLVTGGSDFHGLADGRHAAFPGVRGLTQAYFDRFLLGRKRILQRDVE